MAAKKKKVKPRKRFNARGAIAHLNERADWARGAIDMLKRQIEAVAKKAHTAGEDIGLLYSRTNNCERMPDHVDKLGEKLAKLERNLDSTAAELTRLMQEVAGEFKNYRQEMDRFEHARKTTADRLDQVTKQ